MLQQQSVSTWWNWLSRTTSVLYRTQSARPCLEGLEERITPTSAVLVKDVQPIFRSLTDVNGSVFFTAHDETNGIELWTSDGTSDGTQLVKNINPAGDSFPDVLTNVDGTLFFSADDGTNGRALWKSDGTSAGTTLVKDILPGSDNPYLDSLTDVNGTLFFRATGGLWKSDGTSPEPLSLRQ